MQRSEPGQAFPPAGEVLATSLSSTDVPVRLDLPRPVLRRQGKMRLNGPSLRGPANAAVPCARPHPKLSEFLPMLQRPKLCRRLKTQGRQSDRRSENDLY